MSDNTELNEQHEADPNLRPHPFLALRSLPPPSLFLSLLLFSLPTPLSYIQIDRDCQVCPGNVKRKYCVAQVNIQELVNMYIHVSKEMGVGKIR